jgi:hypothetical protein
MWRAADGYWLMLWTMVLLAFAGLGAFVFALRRRGLLHATATAL